MDDQASYRKLQRQFRNTHAQKNAEQHVKGDETPNKRELGNAVSAI